MPGAVIKVQPSKNGQPYENAFPISLRLLLLFFISLFFLQIYEEVITVLLFFFKPLRFFFFFELVSFSFEFQHDTQIML